MGGMGGMGGKPWAAQAQMREHKGRERIRCPRLLHGGDYSSKSSKV
jgi:hypothetical protein